MSPFVRLLRNHQPRESNGVTWSLPRQRTDGSWIPGEWQGDGTHLFLVTTDPARHFHKGDAPYQVEFEHVCRIDQENGGLWVPKARLVRRLAEEDLVRYGFVYEGHRAVSGAETVVAFGDCSVSVSEQAVVKAFDKVKVYASGLAQVFAHDKVTVEARDHCAVTLADEAECWIAPYRRGEPCMVRVFAKAPEVVESIVSLPPPPPVVRDTHVDGWLAAGTPVE